MMSYEYAETCSTVDNNDYCLRNGCDLLPIYYFFLLQHRNCFRFTSASRRVLFFSISTVFLSSASQWSFFYFSIAMEFFTSALQLSFFTSALQLSFLLQHCNGVFLLQHCNGVFLLQHCNGVFYFSIAIEFFLLQHCNGVFLLQHCNGVFLLQHCN